MSNTDSKIKVSVNHEQLRKISPMLIKIAQRALKKRQQSQTKTG